MSIVPDNEKPGDAVFQQHWHDDVMQYITVIHADPYVLVSDQLLKDILADAGFARLQRVDHEIESTCGEDAETCFNHWLLHINARNRNLVYRLGPYRADTDTWEGRWPD